MGCLLMRNANDNVRCLAGQVDACERESTSKLPAWLRKLPPANITKQYLEASCAFAGIDLLFVAFVGAILLLVKCRISSRASDSPKPNVCCSCRCRTCSPRPSSTSTASGCSPTSSPPRARSRASNVSKTATSGGETCDCASTTRSLLESDSPGHRRQQCRPVCLSSTPPSSAHRSGSAQVSPLHTDHAVNPD